MLRVYQFPYRPSPPILDNSIAGGAILSYACDRFMVADGPYTIQINEVANKMVIPSWITLICRSSIPIVTGRRPCSMPRPIPPGKHSIVELSMIWWKKAATSWRLPAPMRRNSLNSPRPLMQPQKSSCARKSRRMLWKFSRRNFWTGY